MARDSDDGYSSFEDLEVYVLDEDLVEEVYMLARTFPDHERFGQTNQLRRAVSSITLNIAEGRGRGTHRDFLRCFYISRGSLLETVSPMRFAARLKYTSAEKAAPIREHCRVFNRKLNALIISQELQNP